MVRVLSALVVAALATITQGQPARRVAVTFDDLPVAGGVVHDATTNRAITTRLLDAVRAHRVPAFGFVIGQKVAPRGTPDAEQVALLRLWLDRGLELGNHTFSHADFHAMSLDQMKEQVVRGDDVLRPILAARGLEPRYFRHPMLHTARDPHARDAFDAFLRERGYTVAPVTIDNDDYIFARAYDVAVERGDRVAAGETRDAFVPYMDAKFTFFERNEQELFGRPIAHVLLLHANRLNADTFGDLATMLERRGYRFVTLDEALRDPAYQSVNGYDGPAGMTWLHRWALTRGMPKAFYQGEPDVPEFVKKAAK